ncbi:MAG: TadE/TadG family type IV pilus assembly protein [Anaerolineae bacterium]
MLRRLRDEAGANLVEFALVLPVLLFLLIGVVDFGRGYYTYIAVTNAAREGARRAVVYPRVAAEAYVKQAAEYEAAAGGLTLDPANITIQRVSADPQPGEPISVTVTTPYTTILGGFIGPQFQVLTMTHTTSMDVFVER